MAVVTITKDNFEAEVLGCKIPVVLDFWAEWCEPCKMQSTVIEELAAELDGKVKFGKVNVDEEASLALNYQIMSIPTLVVCFREKQSACRAKMRSVKCFRVFCKTP
jgi:thioredoxin 1